MGKVHVRYTLIDCINGNITDELMILSGGKNVMTLIELNETIFALEKQIEMLNTQMIEFVIIGT